MPIFEIFWSDTKLNQGLPTMRWRCIF